MEDCTHPYFEYEMIDGREYGICTTCLWICNGAVARLRSE